jgi:hypothetical protein
MPRASLPLALAVALFAGCADAETEDDGIETWIDDTHVLVAPTVDEPEESEDICAYLPAEGPCALLCDPDALVEQYVPEHVCVVFACVLTNGKHVTAHACHRP